MKKVNHTLIAAILAHSFYTYAGHEFDRRDVNIRPGEIISDAKVLSPKVARRSIYLGLGSLTPSTLLISPNLEMIESSVFEQVDRVLNEQNKSALAFESGKSVDVVIPGFRDPVTFSIERKNNSSDIINLTVKLWGNFADEKNQKILSEVMARMQANHIKGAVVWAEMNGKKSEIWINPTEPRVSGSQSFNKNFDDGSVKTILELRVARQSMPNLIASLAAQIVDELRARDVASHLFRSKMTNSDIRESARKAKK